MIAADLELKILIGKVAAESIRKKETAVQYRARLHVLRELLDQTIRASEEVE